ncbi:zinc ribbon domain-containing protein [Pseudonocardia benzenivorans]
MLLVQRCRACAAHTFTPQDFCRTCLSCDLDWVESGGEGSSSPTPPSGGRRPRRSRCPMWWRSSH